jgi:hypothetical protein
MVLLTRACDDFPRFGLVWADQGYRGQDFIGWAQETLAVALAAVHATRPAAIRGLTLDDVDLPNRRITLAGHRQRMGDLW